MQKEFSPKIIKFRYQKGITPHIKSRKVHCLCGFPALRLLLELRLSIVVINYFCLIFMHIWTTFCIYYIIYLDLMIFCCQYVATTKLHLSSYHLQNRPNYFCSYIYQANFQPLAPLPLLLRFQ